MDPTTLSSLTQYVPDAILILISGSACLYCALLNRKLKNLNNLKTGVGASIVSLTEAIEQTHQAAQQAQTSTLQTTETLRHLLDQAESAAPKVEALIAEIESSISKARQQRQRVDTVLEEDLTPATDKARTTASSLLKLMTDIEQYKQSLHKGLEAKRLQIESEANGVLKDIKQSSQKDAVTKQKNALTYEKEDVNITDLFDLNIVSQNEFRPKLSQTHKNTPTQKIAL